MTSTQLQFRKGNTSQHSTFTGAFAEVTVDTDKKVIVVHDAVTPGGTPMATGAFAQAAFNKANTIPANVRITASNTAGYVPAANTLLPGELFGNLVDGKLYMQLTTGKIIDLSTRAVGKTWYVSTNGSDTFDGTTPSGAKGSIRAALAVAQPGDVVQVFGGTYTENNPLIIPQNVELQGAGERSCIVQPADPTKDIIWVNNNSYVTGFKFINYSKSAIAFPDLVIDANTCVASTQNTFTLAYGVPYDNYYNSMTITITGGTGAGQYSNVASYNAATKICTMDVNWNPFPTSSSTYTIGIPLRTIPAANTVRYTTCITGSPYIYNSSSITTNGTGIKVDGALATGNKSIISAQFTQVNSGGKGVHITNDGYSQLVSIYGIFCDTAFLAENGGSASLGNCNVNFGNKGLVANGKGSLAMTAAFANTSAAACTSIYLNTISSNAALGITATVPYSGLVMKINGDDANNFYQVASATSLSSGNTQVTFQLSLPVSWPSGTTVSFYQQSQLRASGQTFEFVGAGTSIGALPKSGGVANTAAQTIAIAEGAVFATSTDQDGNFTVSSLVINQSTSTITGRTFSKSLFAEMTPYILALEA